jgi:hypothetical protein
MQPLRSSGRSGAAGSGDQAARRRRKIRRAVDCVIQRGCSNLTENKSPSIKLGHKLQAGQYMVVVPHSKAGRLTPRGSTLVEAIRA